MTLDFPWMPARIDSHNKIDIRLLYSARSTSPRQRKVKVVFKEAAKRLKFGVMEEMYVYMTKTSLDFALICAINSS
ncbi:MAG: hypothetical protein H6660_01080 [Ardenticatenaceae bacterium]|nr:hypothetical protein [Ardenticatenaceae bacterium]